MCDASIALAQFFNPPPPFKNGAGAILHSDLSVLCTSLCKHYISLEHYISETHEGNFAQFWSQMYWVRRYANRILMSKVQRSWSQQTSSQQTMIRKPSEHHISQTSEGNFTQFWSQTYLGL